MSWKFTKEGLSRSEVAKKNNFGKWMNGKNLSQETKNKLSLNAKNNGYGLWMKGKKLTEEHKKNIGLGNLGIARPMLEQTKQKLSQAHKGKRHSPETEFKKGENLGEKSLFWKGNEAGYVAIHTWLRKNKPMPKNCEFCNSNKFLTIANMKNHTLSRNPEDYKWLCWSCHHKFDYGSYDGLSIKE